MAVTATVLPDGSVTVVDGPLTFPPLSPEAVQAVAAQATASANAGQTQQLSEGLLLLAGLLAQVGPTGSATVTVGAGAASAEVDEAAFALVTDRFPGRMDNSGRWVCGPMVISQAVPVVPPDPTPPTGSTP